MPAFGCLRGMNASDGRQYLLLSLVITSMRRVTEGCDLLLQNSHGSQNLQQIILTGIVATYFKPFTGNDGAGRVNLDEFSLSESQRQIHGHLRNARHKIYASSTFQMGKG